MRNAAALALARSHDTCVSGMLRSAKATRSASEYNFVASNGRREPLNALACSRISRAAAKGQERSGDGGAFCGDAILEFAAVTNRRISHCHVGFFTTLREEPPGSDLFLSPRKSAARAGVCWESLQL